MKNKGLIIGLAAAVILAVGIVSILKKPKSGVDAKKGVVASDKGKAKSAAPKTFSKDNGGLTVKFMTSRSKDAYIVTRIFKVIDARSSEYVATGVSSRMIELAPGSYDIEANTAPQRLYKDVKVSKGKETVEDLAASGALNLKVLNSKNKTANWSVRVMQPRSGLVIANMAAGMPFEILPGVYDIEIGTMPRYTKSGIKIEAGKETVADLGCLTGSLSVNVADENGKAISCGFRVKKGSSSEYVTSGIANRPSELLPGTYDVEVLVNPIQSKSGIKVSAGTDVVIDFKAQVIQVPTQAKTASAKAPAKSAKKR